jgi:hypothetical protein
MDEYERVEFSTRSLLLSTRSSIYVETTYIPTILLRLEESPLDICRNYIHSYYFTATRGVSAAQRCLA